MRIVFACGCTVDQPVDPSCACGRCTPVMLAAPLFDLIVESQTCEAHPRSLRSGIEWVGGTDAEMRTCAVLAQCIERMLQ